MAMENSVSNDFLSTFVDGIDVFDCHLPGVLTGILIIACTTGLYIRFVSTHTCKSLVARNPLPHLCLIEFPSLINWTCQFPFKGCCGILCIKGFGVCITRFAYFDIKFTRLGFEKAC